MLFNGSILALDAKGGGSNPPALTMLRIIDYHSKYTPVKKVQFTDSNNRDFEFWIYETIVRFYYLADESKQMYKVFADLKPADIERGIFPASLKDFTESTTYLKKYFEHIAFV